MIFASSLRLPRSGLRHAVVPIVLFLGLRVAFTESRAADTPAAPVLHLTNGDSVPGALKDSANPSVIKWQGAAFSAPFEFATSSVNAIHYPSPSEPPKPAGESCFELAGGDVLFGTLIGLDDAEAEIDVAPVGRLHVRREKIHRIYRYRDSGDLIYLGPNGLTGWQEVSPKFEIEEPNPNAARRAAVRLRGGAVAAPAPPAEPTAKRVVPEKAWREEVGQVVTDRDGVSLRGDFGIPARASLEFELSWKTKPDFALAFGVDADDASIPLAFRFEVWEGNLIAVRESDIDADLAPLSELAPGPGRIHFQAYLDQETGRMLVFTPNGKKLADLTVNVPKAKARGSVLLTNNKGDLRLERLRIGRWNGEPPREAGAETSRIHLTDGSIVYGQVTKFDADAKAFVVREASGEQRIAADRVANVFLSSPSEEAPRAIRAVEQAGTRLSGELVKVEKGEVAMTVPGIREPIRLPVGMLRSLVVMQHAEPPRDEKPGVLEADGLRLHGRMVDGQEAPGASCLAWQPNGSATASPLRPGVSGRILYKENAATRPNAPGRPAVQVQRRVVVRQPNAVGIVGGMLQAFGGNVNVNAPEEPPAPTIKVKKILYLRTGDTIPADVTKIDEHGVWFDTTLSDSHFVPHDKIKAVELAAQITTQIRLNKAKRERLLTLPRMQKSSPPTQLIRSTHGDYLRGRILKMDDKTLDLEVRLDTKVIPRERVGRIIWLHPEELEAKKEEPSAAKEEPTRVQALRSDGIRLTFTPERVADGILSGKSDVLGPCRVKLDEVDQLLIGGEIEKAAAALAYQRWKLTNAQEPKAFQDDDASGRSPGTESALVGKPAPDFVLEMLDGKKFHLADQQGKIVMLDFWATWCGPCLQAMPQVEKVAEEFKDRGVQFVAVNLQESARDITAMLERHKLKVTVALDRDGVVAEKYAANAIPQTVIIDRQGKVARLYVGGGPRLGDQLREALKDVLEDKGSTDGPKGTP
jgi:thiol-disulfide isomerase/thioredoxin